MNFLDKFRYKYDDSNELGIQENKNENKKKYGKKTCYQKKKLIDFKSL